VPEPKAEPKTEPEPKPAEPKEPSKPADPKAKTEPAAKPEPEKPEQFKTPKDLRIAYDRTAKELKETNAKVVGLLQQLESAKTAPRPDAGEVTALTEQLARERADRTALESELKVIRYEKSPEYKAKFLEPYQAASKRAYDSVAQLVITQKNAETGEETQRRATAADFNEVASLPEGAAWQKARAIFGEDAHLIMRHYDRLSEIAQQSSLEIERYRKEAEDREKTDVAKQAGERQAYEAMSRKADDAWKTRSKWFAESEGDDEGNDLLKKGFARVDADSKALTPAQRVIHQSYVRHAAAAYPRLVHKLTAYETRIADLETKLKAFEKSEPGPGKTSPAPKPAGGPTANWEEDSFWKG
jgi:hypothetical protein